MAVEAPARAVEHVRPTTGWSGVRGGSAVESRAPPPPLVTNEFEPHTRTSGRLDFLLLIFINQMFSKF